MDWRTDQAPEGAFNGVAFKWQSVGGRFGRRTALHEYPQSEDWDVEDLGRATRRHTVDCIFIGDDYQAQLDRFITAVEQPGPHTLVHPTRGEMLATAEPVDTNERGLANGMARVRMRFVEHSDANNPVATIDTAGELADAGVAAFVAAEAVLANTVVLDGPEFVRDGLAAQVQGLIEQLAVDVNQIATRINATPGITQARTVLNTTEDAAQAARDVIVAPAQIIALTYGQLRSQTQRLAQLDQWFRFATPRALSPFATRTNRQIEANAAAADLAVQVAAVLVGVDLVASANYPSRDDAEADRDTLLAQIDRLQGVVGDATYDRLTAVRVALAADVATRGANLVRLGSYTPHQTEPAVVTAYRLYGNADRADELVARNGVTHPAFVPGGQVLEVLRA